MDISFQWDEGKNRLNIRKHGISFDEARSVFADSQARLMDDPDHGQNEERFIILGYSDRLRLLVVCHCYRAEQGAIRIFSARRANRQEIKTYEEYLK